MKRIEYKEIYEQAERDSVVHNDLEKKEKKTSIIRTQETLSSVKCALLIGMARDIIIKSYETMMNKKKMSGFFNDSFLCGYEMVNFDDNSEIDYQKVASSFSNKMDFNSFVFGIFSKINRNAKMIISNMNDLFYWLNLYNFTEYSSFEEYCFNNNYYNLQNGEKIISMEKYISGSLKYMNELKER